MRLGLRRFLPLVIALALIAPAAGHSSELIGRNATDVSLKVNKSGQALLTYHSAGKTWRVLAWDAVNAVAPTQARKQVEFKLDYSGGWGTYKKNIWEMFANTCAPYSGPPLAWLVTACTASDGSNWSLQSWQRMLPNYGVPATPDRAVWELRLSHWTGDLPTLTVNANWAYRRFDHIFGSFAYEGTPVFGFRSTPQGNPLDTFGRNLYVDTFNSSYGTGWKRENSFLMHKGTGTFCYGFYPHGPHPAGQGTKYRATIIGPGVTPDIMWEGKPLGSYDPSVDRLLATTQRTTYGSDQLCRPV